MVDVGGGGGGATAAESSAGMTPFLACYSCRVSII